ncbi:hypothetical protein [Catenulispora pinisilvae]|uniref:hypothetical protein n=1 Tax=Catenulispora pinisilvae TaxID=2705253 RepID=UPI001891DE9F|nr:hypothetical protein [Catenulispora pinisilvae]
MPAEELDESLTSETYEAIASAWNSWGRLDSDVIAHLINPAFLGGPAWPALRQAHTITRRDDALLVASSGLADPTAWDDAEPTNGFGIEVYGISPDVPVGLGTTDVAVSWLGELVQAVSNQVAHFGFRVPQMLDTYGLITLALPGLELPDAAGDYLDDDDAPVVMLGLTDAEVPASVPGPLSPIGLVNVKLLTVAEGRFCVNNTIGDENARGELARRFAEQDHPLWSSLKRPSVL